MKTEFPLSRLWTSTRLIVEGHILNPLWWNATRRRARRSKVFGDVVSLYFRKHYIDALRNYTSGPVVSDDAGEKIYSIWFQGESQAPELVRRCFDSIRKHCSNELVVLDGDSLLDNITLPQIIIDKYKAGKIKPAHFADICRVELLYERGGYWLDATCFVTSEIPDYIRDADFFVYRTGNTISGYYSYIQNCFIRARKGSYLLGAWREMILDFWTREDKRVDYFQHQIMFKTIVMNIPEAGRLFREMPQETHDAAHRLWLEYGDKPFDAQEYKRIVADAFFQKTTYRDKPIPGTYKDYVWHDMLI